MPYELAYAAPCPLALPCRVALPVASPRLGAPRARPVVTLPSQTLEAHAVLLGQMGELLGSIPDQPDPNCLLPRIARLAVPLLGDLCALDILDARGALHRAACAHVDPIKEGVAHETRARHGFKADDAHGPLAAIRDRRPILVSPVTAAILAQAANSPEQLDLFWQVGARAMIVVPMIARERVIGALTLALTEPGARGYERADLLFAEAFAGQVALAFEHAELFRETATARETAEAATRAKDEFLSTLSHELRAPLNAVYGWATLLDRGQLDAEQSRRALTIILRNVNTQVRLIEDLLDLSRVTSGKIRLLVQAVDLQGVIQEALDSVRPAADAKSIRLQSVLASPAGSVSGDRDRLQQVVWNLLCNAVKFTPKGGRVQIHLQRIRSHVEIIVRDTGQGIRAEVLPHVFDRFRQGDSTSTRSHGGLGLGLALVRSLVELHGGTVTAESPGEGSGATFVVKLPIMLAGADSGPARVEIVGTSAKRPGGEPLAGLRVLVVDDDPTAVELNSELLARAGAEVRGCGTAAEALETIPRWRPDVLISDIEMPGLDGYGLLREIRALGGDRGGQTPAVAVSAYSRPEDRIRSLRAGFNTHVSKPVEPSELTAIVASLAGRVG